MWEIIWQIYPSRNGNFTFLFIGSYSESSDVAEQVADIPLENGNFIFLLIDSFFKSYRGGRYTPQNGNFRFLLLRAQMWQIRWQIYPPEMAILDSYFESSDVGDQVADIPPKMAILHSYL